MGRKVKDDLKKLIDIIYTKKMYHLRTPQLNVLELRQLWDG